MTPQQVFSIANTIALAGWLLLAVTPRRRWAMTAAGVAIPAAFAALYLAIIVVKFWSAPGGFSSLAAVAQLFADSWLLLAGWLHYLAFDLLVGAWEVRDARERRIPHAVVLPCLLGTFLFGPAGWLLYLVIRQARR